MSYKLSASGTVRLIHLLLLVYRRNSSNHLNLHNEAFFCMCPRSSQHLVTRPRPLINWLPAGLSVSSSSLNDLIHKNVCYLHWNSSIVCNVCMKFICWYVASAHILKRISIAIAIHCNNGACRRTHLSTDTILYLYAYPMCQHKNDITARCSIACTEDKYGRRNVRLLDRLEKRRTPLSASGHQGAIERRWPGQYSISCRLWNVFGPRRSNIWNGQKGHAAQEPNCPARRQKDNGRNIHPGNARHFRPQGSHHSQDHLGLYPYSLHSDCRCSGLFLYITVKYYYCIIIVLSL